MHSHNIICVISYHTQCNTMHLCVIVCITLERIEGADTGQWEFGVMRAVLFKDSAKQDQ